MIRLKRIGRNAHDHMVYAMLDYDGNVTETYYADIDDEVNPKTLHRLCPKNDPNGEPDYEIANFSIVNPMTEKEIRERAYRGDYMLLSRLQMDCNYYLGYGNRNERVLWAGNVKDQIEKMKELWQAFPEDLKPQWLTWEQILEYEQKMTKNEN